MPKRLPVAMVLALALTWLAACQAAGRNPDNIEIPIIEPTADPSLCLNDRAPQDAPLFEDVTSSQLVTQESGIRIFDRQVGSGTRPTIADLVTVKYTGWLSDGCIFDSTHVRGEDAQLLLINLIEGWRNAMLTMDTGTIRRVEVPSNLAYRELGSPPAIPPNATLTFEIELINVLTPAQAQATATVVAAEIAASATATPEGGAQVTNCDDAGPPGTAPQYGDVTENQMVEQPSGIKTYDLKVGEGDPPGDGAFVCVHYTGWLTDGSEFDSSYSRGEATGFPVGGVIPGFRDAILGMSVGGQRRVLIPSDQGYGATGAGALIPPNTDLVFDIVLESYN
ncbi:MAG: FKBP-type peptidyl-prolyl cis-trans isomerase [Dehalococcoidia bacterium]|jgi:peptidylprolyl isomerase|nr:FKBP-type peptidyl-prolyl cis-trans isomerase [Dehalococcoidia bacterium]